MALTKEIEQVVTTLQILDLRESGNADLVPKQFAKFTDQQIAASALQQMTGIYAAIVDRQAGAA